MTRGERDPLAEQVAYYRARAGEYDEWFLRRGRYDRGPEATAQWFREVEAVRGALDRFAPGGNVLELAAGTGIWTARLAAAAARVTAVDTSPEALALNRARTGASNVDYVRADAFTWRASAPFDDVFFGFWLSHVPGNRFEGFWETVRRALVPGGRVFFVDSRYQPDSTARDHRLEGPDAGRVTRRLNDGRAFRIVKVFHEPAALAARLDALGWTVSVRATACYFIYGEGSPRPR